MVVASVNIVRFLVKTDHVFVEGYFFRKREFIGHVERSKILFEYQRPV